MSSPNTIRILIQNIVWIPPVTIFQVLTPPVAICQVRTLFIFLIQDIVLISPVSYCIDTTCNHISSPNTGCILITNTICVLCQDTV